MIESERMEEYHKRCVVVVSFLEQWDIIISIILEAWGMGLLERSYRFLVRLSSFLLFIVTIHHHSVNIYFIRQRIFLAIRKHGTQYAGLETDT